MKLKCFALACFSFVKKLNRYTSIFFIINGFKNAFLISLFIYVSKFNNELIAHFGCLMAIMGLYFLLKSKKEIWFWSGFFTGILWFYWISFSLFYYDLAYLIPFEILLIGLIYGLLFWLCGYFDFLVLRVILIAALSHIHPFDFNWFNLELIFVDTMFKPNLITLVLVLLSLCCTIKFKFGFLSIFIALSLSFHSHTKANLLPFKVEIANTNIAQDLKWDKKFESLYTEQNIKIIQNAILNKANLVVLPESAFTVFLNTNLSLIELLKQLSNKITILTGALAFENGNLYNSAFLFQNGQMKRFDKVILVPFGEKIPLPNFMTDLINKIFFNNASDFKAAKEFSVYEIDGIKITNAICYEVTRKELYENNPKFVIAITNNAWFTPSIEPNLQRLLIKYYSTKYKTVIYHSVNGSKSEIIKPY